MAMQKITVALAPDVVRRAKKAVRQGRAKSLSAYVNGVLDERLRRDELDEVLAEMDAHYGPVDEETRAWARSVLSS
jgi:Arc/MetJ-type ribon-helix-helix transcriptional regulator